MVFLGNEKAKETLKKMSISGRLSHAILLCGEKGIGKKTFARLLAQAFLCEDENSPCGVCDACKKVENKTHVDVDEICEFTRPNTFSVERVREIRKDAYISPNEGKKRVFILANADCMTTSAQNALLKIIEEPPETAVFILTAQNRENLLPTVLSRCVTIPVLPIDETAAKERVEKLYPDFDKNTLSSLSQVFGGNVGALIEAVNNPKALDEINVALKLIDTLIEKDRYETLVTLSKLQNSSSATPVLENAVFILSKSVSTNAVKGLDTAPIEARVFWLSTLIGALSDIRKNANIPLLMTHLCVKLYSYSF